MRVDNAFVLSLWERIPGSGGQQAFRELFELYYARLVHFSKEYVEHKEAAEEVVSDVFLKIWNKRKTNPPVTHPETYLYTAVRNQSLNYLRQFSTMRVVHLPDLEQTQICDPVTPAAATEWKELLFRLDQAVDALPPERRRIFKLMKEEGFKAKEVADILGISVRTVETHLYKAVKQLQVVILPYLSDKRSDGAKMPPEIGLVIVGLLSLLGQA